MGDVIRIMTKVKTVGGGGATPSGIEYSRPFDTGQDTSYRVNDDAYNRVNNPYTSAPTNPIHKTKLDTFITLIDDNVAGNKDRFDDENGLQVFGNDYIIDNFTGLGYLLVDANTSLPFTNKNWNDAIDFPATYTHPVLGFSDFYIPNKSESGSILKYEVGKGFLYSPLSSVLSQVINPWTSTTNVSSSISGLRYGNSTGQLLSHAKTSTSNIILVRHHF